MDNEKKKQQVPRQLFRSEALNHAYNRAYGNIVLAKPTSFAWLTCFFTVITLIIILFLLTFSYTRKAQVTGVLLPTLGLIRVIPPQDGLVSEVLVKEGESVHAGQILFVISNEHASEANGEVIKTITSLLQARRSSLANDQELIRLQANQKLAASQRKINDLLVELSNIDEQIRLQQRRVALAESSVERNSKLLEANFISIAGLQDKQAELLDQQTKLSDLKRSKVITMRERDEFVAELQDARIQMQRNDESSLREVNNIDQRLTENEAKRIFYVLAPKAGVISGIATQVGQKVNTGQILANLSPAGSPLGAELYATSKASGFIKPGMHVLIRYQAYPYQKFGQFHGLVKEVSLSPLTTGELITSTLKKSNTTEPIYRIKVQIDNQTVLTYGKPQPLKAGMLLDASILLDRRKLIEWLFEPVLSIGERI